jgi:recombination protein RecR
MARYPSELKSLIAFLKKLPGVGTKTAERFAFQMLSWQESELQALAHLTAQLKEKITSCPECHCLCDQNQCPICTDIKRESSQLCILASAREVYVLEETGTFRGLYHVLGGLLSPIDGKMPEHLHLAELQARLSSLAVKEVIIALDSTIEGDTTALFLKSKIQEWGFPVSRLAFGLPMGSSLDFVDGGTLARAFTGRQAF